jgi:plasmid maintenance system antidote protein VapI
MSPEKTMTGQDVKLWSRMVIEFGMAESEAGVAKLLGVTRQTLNKLKRDGADLRTDLACRAIMLSGQKWSDYVKSVMTKQSS